MLRELHISNLAVIEDAAIDFQPGLNVVTGQTGAGKSLILGAFELLMGLRTVGKLLRAGAPEGRVTGVFELPDPIQVTAIQEIADLSDTDLAPGDSLIITRKLFSSGRSSVSMNGRPATLAMLKKVGSHLIDLQGNNRNNSNDAPSSSASAQNETLLLLKPSYQLDILDHFADNPSRRTTYAQIFQELRQLQQQKVDLETGSTLRRDQLDLYQFQAHEIDEVDPTPGEYDELQSRFRFLSNIERLIRDARNVHQIIYDSENSIAERSQYALAILRELTDIDEDLAEVRDLTEQAAAASQEAAFTLNRYLGRLNFDAEELSEVTDRLNALNRLTAKYGSGTYPGIFDFRAELAQKLAALQQDCGDANQIDERIQELRQSLAELGQVLNHRRHQAAQALKPNIEAQLHELAMPEAEFNVELTTINVDASPTGTDQLEMLIRTNPGQPMLPLRSVASGGELARIMLALKTVLAESEQTSVLIFDEIDAKIGGRLGTVIGDKLRQLSANHQVLCITHLPQIAAYADHHLRIVKETEAGETRTSVATLATTKSRAAELAEMLAGKDVTKTTTAQARELLRLAHPSTATTKPKKKSAPIVKVKATRSRSKKKTS